MKNRLDIVEIYITNVCNYSCTHCQSFNNYAFKGHQRWDDYKDAYKELSKKLDIGKMSIIGGEPVLNPDFNLWLYGLSEIWPNTQIEISTNGSRLDLFDNKTYKLLEKNKGSIQITCHDKDLYDGMKQWAYNFLQEVTQEKQVRQYPGHTSTSIIDKNGVEILMDWTQAFLTSAIDIVDNELVMKYDNDPAHAHRHCHFKTCHQINKGKLYKCPLVSVLPDFLNQFDVKLSNSDRDLAMSYNAVGFDATQNEINDFVNNINNPIPQCKFCPVGNKLHKFVGTDKKVKLPQST